MKSCISLGFLGFLGFLGNRYPTSVNRVYWPFCLHPTTCSQKQQVTTSRLHASKYACVSVTDEQRWTKQLIFAEIRPGNSTNKLHSMVWIFVERMVNTGMNVYPHVNTCLLNRADRSTSTNKVYPSNIDITPSPPPLSLHIRFHQPAGMSRVGGSQNWSRQVIGSTVRIWSPWIRSFQNVPGI